MILTKEQIGNLRAALYTNVTFAREHVNNLLETVADLQSRLAQAEEQTKLEVTARLKEAAEIAHNQKNSDNRVIEEKILALVSSDCTSLFKRRMNEARLEEAKSIPVNLWPQSVGEGKVWNMYRTMRIEALKAELRRVTAGKGQDGGCRHIALQTLAGSGQCVQRMVRNQKTCARNAREAK